MHSTFIQQTLATVKRILFNIFARVASEAVKELALLRSRGFSPVKMVPYDEVSLYGTEVPAPKYLNSFTVSPAAERKKFYSLPSTLYSLILPAAPLCRSLWSGVISGA